VQLLSHVVFPTLPKPDPAILRPILISGALAGFGLLGRRIVRPSLRGISSADDYISNVLVTMFVVLAAGTTMLDTLIVPFALFSALLMLYLPLSKIRHCFFFFYTRILFGSFYGRRGIVPHREYKRPRV
jgi:nitrate reductase gamma subunit